MTKKELIAQKIAKQRANLDYIISEAKKAGLSLEEAYIAAWVARAESNLGIDLRGKGSISGMYQYSDGTWQDRKAYYNSHLDEYPEFIGFDWNTNRNTNDGQLTVFLADIQRCENEYSILSNGGMEAENLLKNLQISKAWNRLGENSIPYTIENYIYMRHNTDPKQVLTVDYLRLLDRDGWYSRIEEAVEVAYGEQIPDSYSNPSLSLLIQELAGAMQLDINGMNNIEALGYIKERLDNWTQEGVDMLIYCLSGYKPWDASSISKYNQGLYIRRLMDRYFKFNDIKQSFTTATTAAPPPPRGCPLVLDLDGDGVETTSLNDGSYFDHDANGFAEKTGWVASDDGLLVMDRNGDRIVNDGKELFGDQTILKSGTKAANGFQALAELDDNKDGKIDANDSTFSQLRVWQDFEGDGYSSADELYTLNELGIAALNTGYTNSNTTDSNGNIQMLAGTFKRSDGTAGQMDDYSFRRDTTYTIANEWLDVPTDTAALPDLQGYGNVYDLQQAMVRDTSGQLKSLVEQFVAATDPSVRNSLMDQILFEWTGSDGINPTSRGSNIDARKLAVLEKFFGEAFVGVGGSNPNVNAAALLNQSYKGLFEMFYAGLMSQTHLKDLYNKITYTWDETTGSLKGNLSGVVTTLQSQLILDPTAGKVMLGEFARTLHGFQAEGMLNYWGFRGTFAAQSEELGWVIDSVGKNIINGTLNNDSISGTGNDDAIRGDSGNDYLYGNAGNDVLYGQEGNDYVYGRDGNDVMDGGVGNDYLSGEAGSDTYLFGRGSGVDTISNYDTSVGKTDTIQFGSGVMPSDVRVTRYNDNLILSINGTSDQLTVSSYFYNYTNGGYKLEQVRFAEGTVWDVAAIKAKVLIATEGVDWLKGYEGNDVLSGLGGNDTIYGDVGNDTLDGGVGNDYLSGDGGDDTLYGQAGLDNLWGGSGNDLLYGGLDSDYLYGDAGNDVMDGGSGNDYVYGRDGNDVMDGGVGNDYLSGEAGSDMYLFGRGSGQDAINDYDVTAGSSDKVKFSGLNPIDLIFANNGNNLNIQINNSSDLLTAHNQNYSSTYQVEVFEAADGRQLLSSKVSLLIQEMAGFSASTGMSWTQLIQNKPDDVQTILSHHWQPQQ
jgi:Ca2+-binding RTX toxin-like protein